MISVSPLLKPKKRMNYNIEVVTAATTYPVSTSELKTHLGISHSDHDTMLEDIIAAATNLAEVETWQVMGSRTLRMNLDCFEDTVIPRYPISAISSVKYYDTSNVLQTMSTYDYDYDISSFPARIHFRSIPSTYNRMNAIQVNFTAGHSTISTVEKGIKQAIKMIAADMYDQRGSLVHGASSMAIINYRNLLAAFRKNYFF